MFCVIKAVYVAFLVQRNRNVANETRGPTKWLVKKYLFSHFSLKARRSASTFLRFVNIVKLLRELDKRMSNPSTPAIAVNFEGMVKLASTFMQPFCKLKLWNAASLKQANRVICVDKPGLGYNKNIY